MAHHYTILMQLMQLNLVGAEVFGCACNKIQSLNPSKHRPDSRSLPLLHHGTSWRRSVWAADKVPARKHLQSSGRRCSVSTLPSYTVQHPAPGVTRPLIPTATASRACFSPSLNVTSWLGKVFEATLCSLHPPYPPTALNRVPARQSASPRFSYLSPSNKIWSVPI
jgi:hypothetical protein